MGISTPIGRVGTAEQSLDVADSTAGVEPTLGISEPSTGSRLRVGRCLKLQLQDLRADRLGQGGRAVTGCL